MKITKKQLSRIIREAWEAEFLPPMTPKPGYEMEDQAEYQRGYRDGYEGWAKADVGTTDYDVGYEDGEVDASSPDPVGEPI